MNVKQITLFIADATEEDTFRFFAQKTGVILAKRFCEKGKL